MKMGNENKSGQKPNNICVPYSGNIMRSKIEITQYNSNVYHTPFV
jgi:hypothetical protein